MYLCRELAGLSYPEIARQFDRRDHTTALHAYRKMRAHVLSDNPTRALITRITKAIRTPAVHNPPHIPSTAKTSTRRSPDNLDHSSELPNNYS
jgi:hypothetical protein